MLRHQIIEGLLAPHTEQAADAAIKYWDQMAAQMISIIGEEGFYSLYTRSVFLAQRTYPWLASITPSAQPGQRFTELKTSFSGRSSAEVRDANTLLLVTFTNILATLIGEELLTTILRLAWGAKPDNTGEEFMNE